jgi:hypothetical protein
MSLMTVKTLGPELMKLLGIPPQCSSFELRCAADEIVSVKCEFYPLGDAGTAAAIGKVLADYELVRRPVADAHPKHPAEVIGFDAWMRQRTDAVHGAYMARTRGMVRIDRIVFAERFYESIRPRVLEIVEAL